jgi:hypothetical protein
MELRSRSISPLPDRYRKTQWSRSQSIPARRAHSHCRSSHQQNPRSPALELGLQGQTNQSSRVAHRTLTILLDGLAVRRTKFLKRCHGTSRASSDLSLLPKIAFAWRDKMQRALCSRLAGRFEWPNLPGPQYKISKASLRELATRDLRS